MSLTRLSTASARASSCGWGNYKNMSHIHPSQTRFNFYKLLSTHTLTITHTTTQAIDRHSKVLSVCYEPIRHHHSNSPAPELLIHHTYTQKHTHTHKYCDNDKCRFANKEEIKIPPHQHNVSQMFNARGERYRSDLSCSHTHTQFALVSQPSLHGNLRACSPWGELWWGYEIQRPSRTRERDRDRERTMRLPQRSQNNSRINRAGGMMPHLHTNTHLLTQTHIYTHKQTWRKMFPCMHFVTQFNNT